MLEAAAGETEASVDTQRSLMDLLICLTPSVGTSQLLLLYRAVKQQLQHPDVLLQKKAYKVVAAIAAAHEPFVQVPSGGYPRYLRLRAGGGAAGAGY